MFAWIISLCCVLMHHLRLYVWPRIGNYDNDALSVVIASFINAKLCVYEIVR